MKANLTIHPPISLAIIGAGIFTRGAHIPALLELGRDVFDVKAIFSRTRASAAACAALFPYTVETVTELQAVLGRQDIEAVDITLPIGMLGQAVEAALSFGKHVVSEKPVATDVRTGGELVARYRTSGVPLVWMVAENFRYHEMYLQAAERIHHGEIGRVLMVNLTQSIPFDEDNKYYHTNWRRGESFFGGMIMDAGVHQAAALRLILGEVAQVSAVASKTRDDLPSFNTLCANMAFDSGAVGNYNVTFASELMRSCYWQIIGEKGMLIICDDHIEVHHGEHVESVHFETRQDVASELAAFAAAIREHQLHRNTPEQALQDVALIEAMLQSAEEQGNPLTPPRIQDW